jgi:beta-lactamase class C
MSPRSTHRRIWSWLQPFELNNFTLCSRNRIANVNPAMKNCAMNRRSIFTILITALFAVAPVRGQGSIDAIVAQNVRSLLPQNGRGGGVAVAIRMNGRAQFFNYGFANLSRNERVTADSIFNLGSVGKLFATTILAEAVKRGELSLGDPVAKYVTELQRGGDVRRITLGQLASHTSGLPGHPGQYEKWHRGKYTWPDFVRFLNAWKADPKHEPGKQYLYSDTGMILLRIALQRRFNMPFARLMHQRITGPLGMTSTALPLPRNLLGRAVQGYSSQGQPIGTPGMEGGAFEWPGTGQIYSPARDMAIFLAANMGELANHGPLENGMALAQQPVFTVNPRFSQALAWQDVRSGNFTILDKNGGLPNTSTWVGFTPQRKIAVVILCNRGKQPATRIGRQLLHALAQDQSQPSTEGEPNPDGD